MNNLSMVGDSEQASDSLKYRDKRTLRFANGEYVREFQAFKDQAERRLDILETAINKNDLMKLPSNHFEASGRYMARTPIHPGKFLADELDALNMNASELAQALHVPANRIYQILQGKRAITADTALRLSQWLGTSAEVWLNLQKLYELRLAEQEMGEEIRNTIKQCEGVQHKQAAS